MPAIELALELMVELAQERKTFCRYLHQHGSISEWIARSRMEIDASLERRCCSSDYLTPPDILRCRG